MSQSLNNYKKNIPNALSWLRGVFTLSIILLFIYKPHNYQVISLFLFILASITDFLDGYWARQWQVVSKLGKIIDPLFDKFLVFSLLIILYPLGIIPKVIIVILLARDILTDIMRYTLLARGQVVAAIDSAKYKTTFQMITILLALIYLNLQEIDPIKKAALVSGLIAVIFSLYSGFFYFKNFIAQLTKKENKSSKK